MNKKFEFTGEIKKVFGVTLQQIRAKKDFANVKKGEVGGWIERESNLSVYSDAWVYGDARVYGDAWVYGGEWGFSPLFIQGSKYSICMYTNNKIKIGCQIHSINQWLSHGEKIARLHGFTPEEIEEYRDYVELAAKRYQTQNSKEEK
jgi:hypothetical protein